MTYKQKKNDENKSVRLTNEGEMIGTRTHPPDSSPQNKASADGRRKRGDKRHVSNGTDPSDRLVVCFCLQVESALKKLDDQNVSPPSLMPQLIIVTNKSFLQIILNFGEATCCLCVTVSLFHVTLLCTCC